MLYSCLYADIVWLEIDKIVDTESENNKSSLY